MDDYEAPLAELRPAPQTGRAVVWPRSSTDQIEADLSFFDSSSVFRQLRYRAAMLPAQCRAARAFLDWSQQHLAAAAGVGVVTVRQFEAGAGVPRNATLEALMNTLEAAGIEFLAGHGGGPGVRLKQEDASQDGFLAFLKLYERNRLRALGRQVGALPQFGYAFTYVGREGADLTFRGERLGQVRWCDNGPLFDPPLFPGTEPDLSDQAFDAWISRAEYRRTTGL